MVVVIRHSDLRDENQDEVFLKLEQAFMDPDALGIIVVDGVEGFQQSRGKLLRLGRAFAKLDHHVKEKYACPHNSYQFGWSHGKEVLENGLPDLAKGSFYGNPCGVSDEEPGSGDVNLSAANNVWPDEELPEFQTEFKRMSAIMTNTALKVARFCDQYLTLKKNLKLSLPLEEAISRSKSPKGRLLYYFPKKREDNSYTSNTNAAGKWCGWHCDHGALTCLTKAMYFDEEKTGTIDSDVTTQFKDDLMIQSGSNQFISVNIPEHGLAIQIGQAANILSSAFLRATPHCVNSPQTFGISRCTFALFLQPDSAMRMTLPIASGSEPDLDKLFQRLPTQFKPGMTFGDFTNATVSTIYKKSQL